MATQAIDLTGKKFGKWTVLRRGKSSGNAYWFCRCICGIEKEIRGSALRQGLSRGCKQCDDGCVTHGHTRKQKVSPEYIRWAGMVRRCTAEDAQAYPEYGGRGIKVCERWLSFENFLADMGPMPKPRMTIDRHPDQDGNYEPGNCRWATYQQQARNTRRNLLYTRSGATKTLAEWVEQSGLRYGLVYDRLFHLGWSFEDAISIPAGKQGPK